MTSAKNTAFVDYYKLLGIAASTDIAGIRKAFLAKAKHHHPDAGGSTSVMQQLNVAYKTLTSPTAKAAYDMLHSFHIGNTKPNDYKYHDGREVNDVTEMSDDEIDIFLDSLFTEYRDLPTKDKPTVKQRFKHLFDF